MKKTFTLFVFCLMANLYVFAADFFWVGPSNGSWSISSNWSSTRQGPGGAGVPGSADSVIITGDALIKMDASPTIRSLSLNRNENNDRKVTLYTAAGSVFTVLNYFNIVGVDLVDSTSENVPFNFVLKGSTHATGLIDFTGGTWTFVGRVPVTGGNGATLTAEPGSLFTVRSGGRIISAGNSAYINCDPSSLNFSLQSGYNIVNNLDAAIPNATFEPDLIRYVNTPVPISPPPIEFIISGARISVEGKMDKLKHLSSRPRYTELEITLDNQSLDAALNLPDSIGINRLRINNTNGYTLSLFTNESGSAVLSGSVGNFYLSGDNSKVAMAVSSATSSSKNYNLQLGFYTQTGGNFSLQDYNGATGSSTLAISRDFIQSGGSFITKSNSASNTKKFVLEMNGGDFYYNRPFGNDSRGQSITMSSATIDNGHNNVSLRINTPLIGYNGYVFGDKGVILKSPLSVPKLELLKGAVYTTGTNILTVTDPGPSTGVITGKSGESYVVGPFRRNTNSTVAYIFPTGGTANYNIAEYFRPVSITPVATTASLYQAELVNSKYANLKVTPPLNGVSNTEYWQIAKVSGADASVTLPFYKAIIGSSSSDAIVVAHYVNDSWITAHGTILKPGSTDSAMLASRSLSSFGPFALGYGNITADTIHNGFVCAKDTTIVADPNTCKAKVSWTVPSGFYPTTYNLENGDKLNLKGIFNGHAYYISGSSYQWEKARSLAGTAGGHLVTITSAAENDFINSNLIDPNRQEYTWIGLYNTGRYGEFAWVTGEPLSYTNWLPGEPNNLFNTPSDTYIFEPYVHINGYVAGNKWNDNGYIDARFIAEFDSSQLIYRQYSGPANGSMLDPGVYTICYERTDRESGKRDSCCFNITVVCSQNSAATRVHTIDAVAYPNPTSSSFILKFHDYNRTEKLRMEVTDATGKLVEVKDNIGKDNLVRFGSLYHRGMYFARIIQGRKVVVLKLVKH